MSGTSSNDSAQHPSPPVIIRNGSEGLKICSGTTPYGVTKDLTARAVRTFQVSPDGRFLVWSDQSAISVYNLESNESTCQIVLKDTPQCIKISPKSSNVASFFNFKASQPGQPDEPNIHIHELSTGSLKGSFVSKKMSKWDPEWTDDEALCLRLQNTELQFYEDNSFERWVHKMETQKVAAFSCTTNTRNTAKYVACYAPGSQGAASFVRIYRYPNLGNAVAQKSFFKADSVQMMWSRKGDSLLFLALCDVDKSGKSYYGEQKLHFMQSTPNGHNYTVPLKKEGPVHAVSWVPGQDTYCVIYGFIPPKVSLFNVKGDIVFDFHDEQPKVNQICFNTFGNIVALAGFGNLRGGVQVWNLENKKKLAEFACAETTEIAWSADGLTLLTATTAPRLRVGNGFKVWKYSGQPLHEDTFGTNVELYQICWQPRPGVYSPPKINAGLKGVKSTPAPPPVPKYVPPGQRSQQEYIRQLREMEGNKAGGSGVNQQELQKKEKEIKTINNKLKEISTLKMKREQGAELKPQQLEKISQENELRQQLAKLQLK